MSGLFERPPEGSQLEPTSRHPLPRLPLASFFWKKKRRVHCASLLALPVLLSKPRSASQSPCSSSALWFSAIAAVAAAWRALEVSMPGLALTTKLEHSGVGFRCPGYQSFPRFFPGSVQPRCRSLLCQRRRERW